MIMRLALVAAVVAVATIAGRWWQARQGRVRHANGASAEVVEAVLFTTPTCRTCPQVRANLDAVAAVHPGFRWTEIDAATDLDRVRAHRVMRAPTIVFAGPGGDEVARVSGPTTPGAIAVAANLDPSGICTAA